MATKKIQPVITHTEILSLAGGRIQAEIVRLRNERKDLAAKIAASDRPTAYEHLLGANDNLIGYHMRRLQAIEILYRLETGTEMGLTEELKEESENV